MGARYEVTQIYHAEAAYEALGRLLHDYREDTSAFLSYERVWLGLLHDVDGKTLKNLTRQATRSNPHVPAYLLGVREPSGREDGNITVGGEDEAEAYASIALKWWLAAAPRTLDWLVDNVRLPKAGRRSSQTRRTQEEPSPGPSRQPSTEDRPLSPRSPGA